MADLKCATADCPKYRRDIHDYFTTGGALADLTNQDEDHDCFVLVADSEVIGAIVFEPNADGWYLSAIAVSADHQESGLSKRFLLTAIDKFSQECDRPKFCTIWWRCHVDNQQARRLSLSVGASKRNYFASQYAEYQRRVDSTQG